MPSTLISNTMSASLSPSRGIASWELSIFTASAGRASFAAVAASMGAPVSGANDTGAGGIVVEVEVVLVVDPVVVVRFDDAAFLSLPHAVANNASAAKQEI